MPPAELREAERDRLAELVRVRTQLRVTERNLGQLEELARRRIDELGVSAEAYLERLAMSSPASGELELVTRGLTVGETYFFRGQIFEALRTALPELVEQRRRAGNKSLRLLSAGCASGEEAYSLAMLVTDFVPDLASWDVTVIGLDINTEFLQKAERASYGRWSLREVAPALVERHFEESGKGLRVRDAARRLVRFHNMNLAVDPLPAPALGVFAMDIVVCQNVLYYFERDARANVVEKLVHATAPRGLLFFGPSDLGDGPLPGCQSRLYGDVVAHQRAAPAAAPASSRRLPSRPALRATPGIAVESAPPTPVGSAVTLQSGERESLGDVVALANEGDLRGAVQLVEAVLAADRDHTRAHALHGLLLAELGALEAALDAFRRASYLEPALLVAHVGAALVARRLGNVDLERRCRARVTMLAAEHASDTPVDGWDGMTVGRLARLFESQPEAAAR